MRMKFIQVKNKNVIKYFLPIYIRLYSSAILAS